MTENIRGALSPTRVRPAVSQPGPQETTPNPGQAPGDQTIATSLIEDGTSKEAERALDGLLRSLGFKASPNGAGASTSGSEVLAQLTKELQAAYRRMPRPMQNQFDAAMRAAKKANPSAWISKLQFSR